MGHQRLRREPITCSCARTRQNLHRNTPFVTSSWWRVLGLTLPLRSAQPCPAGKAPPQCTRPRTRNTTGKMYTCVCILNGIGKANNSHIKQTNCCNKKKKQKKNIQDIQIGGDLTCPKFQGWPWCRLAEPCQMRPVSLSTYSFLHSSSSMYTWSPMHHGLKSRMKLCSGNSFRLLKYLSSLLLYVCTHKPYLPMIASAGVNT